MNERVNDEYGYDADNDQVVDAVTDQADAEAGTESDTEQHDLNMSVEDVLDSAIEHDQTEHLGEERDEVEAEADVDDEGMHDGESDDDHDGEDEVDGGSISFSEFTQQTNLGETAYGSNTIGADVARVISTDAVNATEPQSVDHAKQDHTDDSERSVARTTRGNNECDFALVHESTRHYSIEQAVGDAIASGAHSYSGDTVSKLSPELYNQVESLIESAEESVVDLGKDPYELLQGLPHKSELRSKRFAKLNDINYEPEVDKLLAEAFPNDRVKQSQLKMLVPWPDDILEIVDSSIDPNEFEDDVVVNPLMMLLISQARTTSVLSKSVVDQKFDEGGSNDELCRALLSFVETFIVPNADALIAEQSGKSKTCLALSRDINNAIVEARRQYVSEFSDWLQDTVATLASKYVRENPPVTVESANELVQLGREHTTNLLLESSESLLSTRAAVVDYVLDASEHPLLAAARRHRETIDELMVSLEDSSEIIKSNSDATIVITDDGRVKAKAVEGLDATDKDNLLDDSESVSSDDVEPRVIPGEYTDGENKDEREITVDAVDDTNAAEASEPVSQRSPFERPAEQPTAATTDSSAQTQLDDTDTDPTLPRVAMLGDTQAPQPRQDDQTVRRVNPVNAVDEKTVDGSATNDAEGGDDGDAQSDDDSDDADDADDDNDELIESLQRDVKSVSDTNATMNAQPPAPQGPATNAAQPQSAANTHAASMQRPQPQSRPQEPGIRTEGLQSRSANNTHQVASANSVNLPVQPGNDEAQPAEKESSSGKGKKIASLSAACVAIAGATFAFTGYVWPAWISGGNQSEPAASQSASTDGDQNSYPKKANLGNVESMSDKDVRGLFRVGDAMEVEASSGVMRVTVQSFSSDGAIAADPSGQTWTITNQQLRSWIGDNPDAFADREIIDQGV